MPTSTLFNKRKAEDKRHMNCELLCEFYFLFDPAGDPPLEIFVAEDNEPYENPHWNKIFRSSWDEIPLHVMRMNWDAMNYFTGEAFCYFMPLILKWAIVDAESVDLLQQFFLREILVDNVEAVPEAARRFVSIHAEFILKVLENADYVKFCINNQLDQDLRVAIDFLVRCLNAA